MENAIEKETGLPFVLIQIIFQFHGEKDRNHDWITYEDSDLCHVWIMNPPVFPLVHLKCGLSFFLEEENENVFLQLCSRGHKKVCGYFRHFQYQVCLSLFLSVMKKGFLCDANHFVPFIWSFKTFGWVNGVPWNDCGFCSSDHFSQLEGFTHKMEKGTFSIVSKRDPGDIASTLSSIQIGTCKFCSR